MKMEIDVAEFAAQLKAVNFQLVSQIILWLYLFIFYNKD